MKSFLPAFTGRRPEGPEGARYSASSERDPAGGEGRDAEQPRMREQHDDENSCRRPEAPAEKLSQTQLIAAARNRSKRQVRGFRRKRIPCRAHFALALGVDRKWAEQRKYEEGAEENDGRHIAIGRQVESGPDHRAPQKRVPRNPQYPSNR